MSSSAPDLPESSRAGQEAEQEPESEPQRKWVALVSVPVLLVNEDELAQGIDLGTNVLLDLNEPPLPSYLRLHPRVAPNPRRNDSPLSAYILAADRSACILLQVVEGNLSDFFLCNTQKRTVTILPPVSAYITASGHNIRPRLSIGLITDPQHHGHYVVVQLHPSTSANRANSILCYSTAKGRWFVRGLSLQQASMRNPFSETGVLVHDGRLWWIALAYGVFFCDPCTPLLQAPQLRFLPLPADCEMQGDVDFDPRIRTLIDQRRCVRLSEGKLRFVEIRGLSYDELDDVPAASPTVFLWTLNDPEGPVPWTLEYELAFAEIWDNKTYADAGLLPGEVPHVALVDPSNHHFVYFFQGSKLFGLDMRKKKVVACKECLIDRDILLRSSRPIVDAWELLPPLPTHPGDDDDSSPDDHDFNTMESALADSGLGLLCRREAFCSLCRSPICLSCCPDHLIRHHGVGLGGILRILMTKDGPSVDAGEVKINGLGYDWKLIQRRMHGGRKCIVLRDPKPDLRNNARCVQCNHKVKSKNQYCSPFCKIVHKPNANNAEVIRGLVYSDFNQCSIRDRFCTICRRSFASAHCADHDVHNHGQAAAAATAPPAEAPLAPAVVPLIYHDGWMLLPAHLLEVADGIQRLNVEQQLMFALRNRDELPDGQADGIRCGNAGCREFIQPPAEACSLKCWLVLPITSS